MVNDNIYSPRRTVEGTFAANPRVLAHDALDIAGPGGLGFGVDIPNTLHPARGAALYIGLDLVTLTVIMESGEEITFAGIPGGSWCPVLVTQVVSAVAVGSPSVVDLEGEIVALF